MSEVDKELLANIPPFGLRMQAELKERVKAAAVFNNRSMNAEIIARIESSFSNDSKLDQILAKLDRLLPSD